MKKIQFCCGENKIEGWDNFDKEVDISKPLSFPSFYADRIFIEHGLEHVPQGKAYTFLMECIRILVPGGKIRIVIPDMERVLSINDRDFCKFITGMQGRESDSVKDALNIMFFSFGHKAAWTRGLLKCFLVAAGFTGIEEWDIGESNDNDFQGIEGHNKNKEIKNQIIETTILEGTKPE